MARILIIDDDPAVRGTVERMLRVSGHEPVVAADGKEGVALACSAPVDLVITDLYMPNQEGLETITDFRTRFPGIPIIAMSGKPTAEVMLSIARHLGAVVVLHKPFSTEELLQAVGEAL